MFGTKLVLAPLVLAGMLSGCAAPSVSRNADPSRRSTPVPACVERLAPTQQRGGVRRSFTDVDYYDLVFQDFDRTRMVLAGDSLACTGEPVLRARELSGAEPGPGTDISVADGSVKYGGGGNQLKLVWFRTHRFPDGNAGGPLALVRLLEDLAEVYAVGIYVGDEDRSQMRLERMGNEVVAVVEDDRCLGREPGTTCDSTLHVYSIAKGRLNHAITAPLERVRYATGEERGVAGKIEYHLVSSPEYKPGQVVIIEQISATDERDRPVRKTEHELHYRYAGERFVTSDKSLWDRVFVGSEGTATSEPEPKQDSGGAPEPAVIELDESPPTE